MLSIPLTAVIFCAFVFCSPCPKKGSFFLLGLTKFQNGDNFAMDFHEIELFVLKANSGVPKKVIHRKNINEVKS